jgi:hypothetical protein
MDLDDLIVPDTAGDPGLTFIFPETHQDDVGITLPPHPELTSFQSALAKPLDDNNLIFPSHNTQDTSFIFAATSGSHVSLTSINFYSHVLLHC